MGDATLEPDSETALRIVRDEDGLEALEIGGRPSVMSRKGFPATLGAMGDPDLRSMRFDPERTYLGEAPYGSMDPHERLKVLDAEGIDAVVLYTTVGLLWEAELDDPTLVQAYRRVQPVDLRVLRGERSPRTDRAPVAQRSQHRRARGLKRTVAEEAARGRRAFAPFTHDGRPLGHPSNDPVFAATQDLDVPFPRSTPTFEPQWTKGTRMGSWEHIKELRLLAAVQASDGVRHQFTTLFDYGVFDKFPRLPDPGARVRVAAGRASTRSSRRPIRTPLP